MLTEDHVARTSVGDQGPRTRHSAQRVPPASGLRDKSGPRGDSEPEERVTGAPKRHSCALVTADARAFVSAQSQASPRESTGADVSGVRVKNRSRRL